MSRSSLTLELPAEIYERVRRAAKGMKQPVEQALVNIVKAATPSLERVPEEYRPELEAMEDLGDDALWKLAQARIALSKQRQLENLLAKNQCGKLTGREQQTLASLRTEADRLTLRRSYALLLLKYRGHGIGNPMHGRQ
jgi:hypothetical protein